MPEEVGLTELIRQKYELLKSGDYFALLGVSHDADVSAIRNAYFALAKLLHPDAIARSGLKGLEREATEVFKAITEAYNVLTDKKKRAEYEAQRRHGGAYTTTGRMRAVRDQAQEAKIFFHKGTLFLQRRVYDEAEACFRKAAELDPKTGRYLSYLGYTILMNEALPKEKRLEEAKRLFEEAVEQSTNDHEPYYFLSLYYKAIGDTAKQRQCLEDALAINPKHVESRRELRLLLLRQRKSKSSGWLSGLRRLLSRLSKGKA